MESRPFTWYIRQLSVLVDKETKGNSLSERKLHPIIFRNICRILWTPNIDFFASRISHQEEIYITSKPGPLSKEKDGFQQSCMNLKGYAFPLICLMGRVLRKVQIDMDTCFFSVVYLTLALNSPVKISSLIHANKKIHINKDKYTIKCFLHIFT